MKFFFNSKFTFLFKDCPHDWFNFESSCYQTYGANTYQKAMDKCFWLLNKQKYMKRPYLANIESPPEMDFLMKLMIENKVKEMYIGANNIIKRSKMLLIIFHTFISCFFL